MIKFIKQNFLKIVDKCKVALDILLEYFLILVKYIFYPIVWLFEYNEDILIAPAIGDIVENNEDESRNMVAFVSVDNGIYDIRMFSGLHTVIGKRGRSKKALTVDKTFCDWPPENSTVYRDGEVIYPLSNFKLSKIRFFEFIKKGILKHRR